MNYNSNTIGLKNIYMYEMLEEYIGNISVNYIHKGSILYGLIFLTYINSKYGYIHLHR